MRTHDVLTNIAGYGGKEHAEAMELFIAFSSVDLLPDSFDADAEIQDAQVWALFVFCLSTLDGTRRPNHVANELVKDGVSAWTNPEDENSNAVSFLHSVFTDFDKCMQLDHVLFNRSWQVMRATFKDGTEVHFRNKSAAAPWSSGQVLSINDDQTTVRDSYWLFSIAAFFCGHKSRIYDDESDPRGTVTPPKVEGHKFKA